MNKEMYVVSPADRVNKIADTSDSHPVNGAAWQVIPIDLAVYGYVEEEYTISGKSKLYSWLEGDKYARVLLEDAPYTTRFLVRKPASPEKFSGTVWVEMLNWARHYDRTLSPWGNSWEHVVDVGDVWIGVTSKQCVIDSLKKCDPERYGELGFPNPRPKENWYDAPQANNYRGENTSPETENGLAFDMFSQVGLLCREQSERSPLFGYDVQKVISSGGVPGDIATYVAAVDPISCAEDGSPIYDGHVIFMTGAPSNINQVEPKVHYLDERCKMYGKVPLARVYTTQDILGYGFHSDWGFTQRHPDSDEEGHYYRSYEVSGTGLILKYSYFSEPCQEDIDRMGIRRKNERTGESWNDQDLTKSEFPTRYVLNAVYENMKLWIDGVVPPHTEVLATENDYPDAKLVFDELGNAVGGLRTPYVDVPIYHFGEDAVAEPMTEEELSSKYSDHDDYVSKVIESALDCVAKRLLLPRDAKVIILEAMKSEILC